MLLTLPLAALAIAGCGSDDSSDTSGGSGSAAPPPAETQPAETQPAETQPSEQAAASGGAQEVAIADFKYDPPTITVKAGTKVTWTNEDTAPHNSVGDEFKTKDLEKGDADTVTFDKPGTYDYVCTFHAFMKGSVVVQ